MDAHAVIDFRLLKKNSRSATNKVIGICRQRRVAAGELNPLAAMVKRQPVENIDGVHDGFEFVKTIGAFAQDVQEQVDFAGRLFFERHEFRPPELRRLLDKKKAPTKLLARENLLEPVMHFAGGVN